MFIIYDTREKKPLSFENLTNVHESFEGTRRATLSVGDYACQFKDGRMCCDLRDERGNAVCHHFERKSIPDLFGTLTSRRKRRQFKAEIERAHSANVGLILAVEGTFSRVLKGHARSRAEGIVVARQIITLWLKYGLIPMLCKDREEMARQIIEYYASLGRLYYVRKRKVR